MKLRVPRLHWSVVGLIAYFVLMVATAAITHGLEYFGVIEWGGKTHIYVSWIHAALAVFLPIFGALAHPHVTDRRRPPT